VPAGQVLGPTDQREQTRAIREWAWENGYELAERGRIPATRHRGLRTVIDTDNQSHHPTSARPKPAKHAPPSAYPSDAGEHTRRKPYRTYGKGFQRTGADAERLRADRSLARCAWCSCGSQDWSASMPELMDAGRRARLQRSAPYVAAPLVPDAEVRPLSASKDGIMAWAQTSFAGVNATAELHGYDCPTELGVGARGTSGVLRARGAGLWEPASGRWS
jgi:hypothetical protein